MEASDKAVLGARPGTSEHQLGLAVDIVSTKIMPRS
ncbi:MAG: D-alanyl-D-alanine carboxypeptidase family protein [Thomasclavelia ramosa]